MDKETLRMQMLAGIITESEYKANLNESIEKIFKNFKKDFKDVVSYAGISLDNDIITVYLDNDPNREKNLINKLVREKYPNSIKKMRSAEDSMRFKIIG